MKILLAKVISRLFDPVVWLLVFFILFFNQTNLQLEQIRILLPVLLILELVLPALYMALALRRRKIHDFDITKREERLGLFSFTLALYLLALIAVWFFGNFLAFKFQLTVVLVMAFAVLITYWWKISIHLAANTLGMIVLNYFFAWQLWPLFFVLPLVGWARITWHKHNWQQLITGVLVGSLSLLPLFLL